MQTAAEVTNIARAIEFAVAPVFLLTSIGGVLSVLTARVGRIVDRARQLEDYLIGLDEHLHPPVHNELAFLSRRARLANWAISLCTSCALLICTVVAVLFIGAILGLDVSTAIALLFIAAMLILIAGFVIFLKEIHLATASLCIGPQSGNSRFRRGLRRWRPPPKTP
jgi:Protein of unknown function (DUF2721)